MEKDIIRCSSLLKCCCDLSTIRLLLLRSPLALGCFDESRAGRRGGLPQTIYSGAGPCVGTVLAILAAAVQHSSFSVSIDPSGVSGPVVSMLRSPPPPWGRRGGCSTQALDPASHTLRYFTLVTVLRACAPHKSQAQGLNPSSPGVAERLCF